VKLEELEAINRATLEALRLTPDQVNHTTHPYFGYYTVDIFDCPPFVMFSNQDCPIAFNILYKRKFEPTSLKVWCAFARTATGIIDIGAHVGVYSLAAASLRLDIPIHAFECNPHAFARLRVHCNVNEFDNIIQNNVAIGHGTEPTTFSWVKKRGQPISSGGSVGDFKALGEDVERTVVNMTTLDQTVAASALGNRGLIKIDVEGSEHRVFEGMTATLQQKPDIILETFSSDNCNYINSLLLPLGYRAYLIEEEGGKLLPQNQLYPRAIDKPNFNQLLSARTPKEIAAAFR